MGGVSREVGELAGAWPLQAWGILGKSACRSMRLVPPHWHIGLGLLTVLGGARLSWPAPSSPGKLWCTGVGCRMSSHAPWSLPSLVPESRKHRLLPVGWVLFRSQLLLSTAGRGQLCPGWRKHPTCPSSQKVRSSGAGHHHDGRRRFRSLRQECGSGLAWHVVQSTVSGFQAPLGRLASVLSQCAGWQLQGFGIDFACVNPARGESALY